MHARNRLLITKLFSGFDVACEEHKVCGDGANVTAPNGPCYCCSLELQVRHLCHFLHCSAQRMHHDPELRCLLPNFLTCEWLS